MENDAKPILIAAAGFFAALVFSFNASLIALAIALAIFAVIMTIVLSCPSLVGVRADYPTKA